ncbi:uncharacterized protein LOC135831304 [Planococcus citri]|uniref:uncharacterized protein LOC135831304 n=1 Tax=Planococcus citri TaxID=170843 RepID=UPI0031F9E675
MAYSCVVGLLEYIARDSWLNFSRSFLHSKLRRDRSKRRKQHSITYVYIEVEKTLIHGANTINRYSYFDLHSGPSNIEMKGFKNNSPQSSLSDQSPWKSELRALIEPEIHFKDTHHGKHQPSWDIETLGKIRIKISQDMAEVLQKKSNKSATPIMRAARYGHYSTIEQLLTVPFTSIEPVGGKTILHMVLEGIISLTYKDDPVEICMKNIIAGKDICDSIVDAYFPPDDFNMIHGENPDHYKCLDFILKTISPDKLDINFCDDAGNSALHYAVAWSETTAIKALLQAGAYTCKPNKNGTKPLNIISPQVLEEYLDSCVLSNDYPLGHNDFQIYFNYQLFVLPK